LIGGDSYDHRRGVLPHTGQQALVRNPQPIAELELEMSVLAVERRDTSQGALLRRWLEARVLPAFEDRILPIDRDVARR
jgi:hypothetical protein